ncbi:MAG: serine hydrolase domain-containing protein [Methanoregula sp.]|nr:serine hydrolase domain-containing protein [Methanoregula sp.]
MKFPVLLLCIALSLLVIFVSPPAWGAGIPVSESPPEGQARVFADAIPPHGPSDPAEVEAFLDEIMPAAIARYNVPGATVVVVKDGRVVVAKGYGYRNLANRTMVNADTTTFRIGSISKLFTWTSVMQLAEEGKIDLDADVNTYLHDMKIPDTYAGQPVTMRHLMTHTAGFEDSSLHMTGVDPEDLISIRTYCKENIPARVNPPGKVSRYSNYGTTLAAVVVEDVSGMSFEQYLQSRILTPLAMENTSIREKLPPHLAAKLTQGYSFANSENKPTDDFILVIGPAGSITSTAPDMAKFMIAHLQNGTYSNATILAPKTAELMHARSFANDPRITGMCLGFYEQYYNGRRAIVHGGDTDTFHSLLFLLPEEQTGFFVSGSSAGGRGVRNALFTAFMDHYYPGKPHVLPLPDPSASARLQQFDGSYMSNRHNYARFERYFSLPDPLEVTASPHGTLIISGSSGPVAYAEVGPGVFSPADGTRPADGDVVFHTAADGSHDFFMYRNNPAMVYDRVPWYAMTSFGDGLTTVAGLVLASVLLWPLLALFRRMNRIPDPSVPNPAGIARWIAGLAGLMLLVFVFVLVPWISSDVKILTMYMTTQAVPAALTAVLTLPVIALVLSLAAALFVIPAWKSAYWTLPHRLHYTAVIVALIAMLWWVNQNNLWVFCL